LTANNIYTLSIGIRKSETMVSKRLQSVPASGTVMISNLVSQMKQDGIDITSFSMGEPDFGTPQNIVDSCIASLNSGFTHYTPSRGIPDLRKAIAEVAARDNKIPCGPKNVLVTPTKQALFMIALGFLDPGDEVLLPDPAWVSYEACIKLAGAEPVYVPTYFEDEFCVSPEKVAEYITPKTKMIMLNSPSNPTGCVMPEDSLKAIAEICREKDIMVLSDEIYEHIIYEGKHVSIASMKDMFDRYHNHIRSFQNLRNDGMENGLGNCIGTEHRCDRQTADTFDHMLHIIYTACRGRSTERSAE